MTFLGGLQSALGEPIVNRVKSVHLVRDIVLRACLSGCSVKAERVFAFVLIRARGTTRMH